MSGGPTTQRRRPAKSDDRLIAGVASGLAHYAGVDPIIIRVTFVVVTLATGLGIPVYLVCWWLMPDAGEAPSPSRIPDKAAIRRGAGVGLLVAGALLLLRRAGLWWSDAVVWPVALAGAGIAILWARSGRPVRVGSPSLRYLVGALLVAGGLGVFLSTSDAVAVTRQVLLAVAVTVAGLALILGPWIRRISGELGDERRARIRSEERAEMAAHLHDSVLQTLALIQRTADRPRETVALARRQERELRAWLYGGAGDGARAGTLAAAVTQLAAEVEERHGVEVDAVTVGDCRIDPHVEALLGAAREAAVNAARHSGATVIDVYVEAEDDRVSAFVRDRGRGFDPDAIPEDRRGVADSIRNRMQRHGGRATIVSEPGDGTEVSLELPLEIRQ